MRERAGDRSGQSFPDRGRDRREERSAQRAGLPVSAMRFTAATSSLVMPVSWDEWFERPLDEVRETLRIGPPPAYTQMRSEGAPAAL